MENLKIQHSQEIDSELLVNLLVGAFEGGSNYWAELGRIDKTNFNPMIDWYENLAIQLLTNPEFSVDVYDYEDGRVKLGELSYVNLRKNVMEWMKYPEIVSRFFSYDIDADDADVLFQIIVLGEVVFC